MQDRKLKKMKLKTGNSRPEITIIKVKTGNKRLEITKIKVKTGNERPEITKIELKTEIQDQKCKQRRVPSLCSVVG